MLLTEFGCAVECFASPLNCRHLRSPSGVRCCVPCCTPLGCALHVVRCCIAVMHTRAVSAIRAAQPHRYARYCSAHLDVDGAFGSLGSFFDFHPRAGSYQASRARAAARA